MECARVERDRRSIQHAGGSSCEASGHEPAPPSSENRGGTARNEDPVGGKGGDNPNIFFFEKKFLTQFIKTAVE